MTAGAATPAQMGAFLMALRVRGETVEEITGAAQMLRSRMNRVEVPPDAIDIVGTGGDSHGTYNVSTCAALVAAGAGVRVAKHGNRRVSSRSGASDVLSELGVKLDVPFDTISRCVSEAGLGFLWAPQHHPALQALGADPRRARHPHHLQPAGADLQSGRRQAPDRRRVLLALGGAHRARAQEPGRRARLGGARPRRPRRAHHHRRHRRRRAEGRQGHGIRGDAGGCRASRRPSSPTSRAATRRRTPAAIRDVLAGKRTPLRDIAVLNAAAALIVAGKAANLADGAALAAHSIESGAAPRRWTGWWRSAMAEARRGASPIAGGRRVTARSVPAPRSGSFAPVPSRPPIRSCPSGFELRRATRCGPTWGSSVGRGADLHSRVACDAASPSISSSWLATAWTADVSGKIAAGSRVDLARSGIGVAVRAGAARPDIGTPDAFRRALRRRNRSPIPRAPAASI